MLLHPRIPGRKIADMLIERVIRDAKGEGFDAVEGYPFADTSFAYQYRGPRHLYEKHGFKLFRDAGWVTVMRLELEDHVWGTDDRVYLKRLREKVEIAPQNH